MMKYALAASLFILSSCSPSLSSEDKSPWILVDNFERAQAPENWTHIDAQNETDPFILNPQIAKRSKEGGADNHYLLRKAAADGVVGNRKAISFHPLPESIPVGETYTLFTRINVESFPNNHSYGLSNIVAANIAAQGYDAFEPMIRITDKAESDGSKNDGTLMVLSGYKTYSKIQNAETGEAANPLEPSTWYDVWAVINNAPVKQGGQSYDVYIQGGEFSSKQLAYPGGVFRMKREAPLTAFMAISNTGSKKSPYGNGGVRYDDIFIAPGTVLTTPIQPRRGG